MATGGTPTAVGCVVPDPWTFSEMPIKPLSGAERHAALSGRKLPITFQLTAARKGYELVTTLLRSVNGIGFIDACASLRGFVIWPDLMPSLSCSLNLSRDGFYPGDRAEKPPARRISFTSHAGPTSHHYWKAGDGSHCPQMRVRRSPRPKPPAAVGAL